MHKITAGATLEETLVVTPQAVTVKDPLRVSTADKRVIDLQTALSPENQETQLASNVEKRDT